MFRRSQIGRSKAVRQHLVSRQARSDAYALSHWPTQARNSQFFFEEVRSDAVTFVVSATGKKTLYYASSHSS
jgi:hypothetical protein